MSSPFRGTSICAVRKNGKIAIAGDGQVTFGQHTVMKANARKVRRLYHDSVLAGFAVFAVLLAAAAVYAAADFYHFWRSFHELLFDNDLWELYPDERLIQMVPQKFFSDLVARIVAAFAGIAALLTAADLIAQKKVK